MGLRSKPLVFGLWLSITVVLPWLGAAIFLWPTSRARGADPYMAVLLIAYSLFIVGMVVLVPLWTTRGAPTLKGTHRYEFSPDGIRLTGPGFDSRVDWASITRCFVCSQGVLFFSGRIPIISFPARAIPPSSSAELRSLVDQKGVARNRSWAIGAREAGPRPVR